MVYLMKIVGLVLALVGLVGPVWGHGNAKEVTQTVGSYNLTFSYDEIELASGEPVALEFSIRGNANSAEVSYDKVFVDISRAGEDGSLLVAPVSISDLGETVVVYKFPESGSYTIEASFRKGSETLAEASFPLTVEEVASETTTAALPQELLFGLAGLLVGAGLVLLLKKR